VEASRLVEIGGQRGCGLIQEEFWPQAQAARANKDRNSQREGCFSHRPFLLDSFFSNGAHDTSERLSFLLTRHLHLLFFRRRSSALQHPANRKKSQGPTKGPNAPSRPSATSPRFRISRTLSTSIARPVDFLAAMKFFESQHEFDYSWEEVSTANWRKYCPWNDKSTHVIAVDTISRHVDPATGIVSLQCSTLQEQLLTSTPASHRTSHHLQTIRTKVA